MRTGVPEATARPAPARRGELRLLSPPPGAEGASRLGLVLRAEPAWRVVEVALVHPYTELATSMDGVVPGTLATTPYDVVVQTDLRGVVWAPAQVSRLVGQLPGGILDAISDLVEGGRPRSEAGVRIGTPLAGPGDRRWAFKVAEGRALDLLTAAATRELLDGQPPRVPATTGSRDRTS